MFTVGIRLPNSGPFASADSLCAVARTAGEMGVHTLWVHDHLTWSSDRRNHFAAGAVEVSADVEPNFFESLVTLARVGAEAGPSVRLGVAGLVLPLRDPRLLARQLLTLDHFSPAGLVVAAGVGAIEDDFRVAEVSFRHRGQIANEHFAALRAALGDQPATYHGSRVAFSEATFLPRVAHTRLWGVGGSDAAVRRAARFAEGWMTVYVTPAEYKAKARTLAEECIVLGRDAGAMELGYETFACVADTDTEAARAAERTLIDRFGSLERAHAVCLVGSAFTVAERVQEYAAAGARHVELKLICRSVEELQSMISLLMNGLRTSADGSPVHNEHLQREGQL